MEAALDDAWYCEPISSEGDVLSRTAYETRGNAEGAAQDAYDNGEYDLESSQSVRQRKGRTRSGPLPQGESQPWGCSWLQRSQYTMRERKTHEPPPTAFDRHLRCP